MNILFTNLLFCVFVGVIIYIGNISIVVKNRVFMYLSFISLVFFHSFVKVDSLPDLPNYKYSYDILKNVSISDIGLVDVYTKLEIGFQYYMKIISLFGINFQFFLLVNSIILILLYYSVIVKYSAYVFVSVLFLLLEYYNQSIFVLRQHLAMALIFASVPYILDGKFYKFVLLCFLAYLCHQTAIVFVPVYFLYNIKSKKTLILILLSASIIVPILFSLVIHFINLNLLHGYDSYLDNDALGANFIGGVIALFFLGYFIFFLRSNIFENGINKLLFIILLLNCIGNIAGIGFAPTNRLFMYYGVFTILVVPQTMKYISNSFLRWGTLGVILSFDLYMYMYGSGVKYIEDLELIF